MRLIFTLAFLLNSSLLFAQMGFQNPAFVAGLSYTPPAAQGGGWQDTYTPTNMVGYPALTWYVAHGGVSTNGSTFTLTDTCRGWNLTNAVGSSAPAYIGAALNGRDVLQFNAQWIRNYAFTNYQPLEVVMVYKPRPPDSGSRYIWANALNIGAIYGGQASSTMGLRFYAGTALTGSALSADQWVAISWSSLPTGTAYIYTNNVLSVTGGGGLSKQAGLIVGANYSLGNLQNFDMAEMIVYGGPAGPLPGTNTTARTTLYNYLKSKYGL